MRSVALRGFEPRFDEPLDSLLRQREGDPGFAPSYDHADVIAVQGTAAPELLDEVGELDVLLVPCGGGGLLSGFALSARALAPRCRVIGVEPELAADATRSFRTGTLHTGAPVSRRRCGRRSRPRQWRLTR